MDVIDEFAQLADSMRQASALLADEDVDKNSLSSRRPSTFLNVVALGNTLNGLSSLELSECNLALIRDNCLTQSPYCLCHRDVEVFSIYRHQDRKVKLIFLH
ncbi:hypothetical protein CsSME_00007553 [Camellia sinensis var. sinensis]